MPGNRTKADTIAQLLAGGLWPRLLSLELAAGYVDLSAAAFLRGVKAGRYPAPIVDGRRRHWDRLAIDRAVDQRSRLEPSSRDESPEAIMSAIDAA